MNREADKVALDLLELDRQAWNLPRPVNPPKSSPAPFSVQSEREDNSTPEREAA